MDAALQTSLRDQLLDRHRRLERVVSEVGEVPDVVRLLREIDSALERMGTGEYGTCLVCHTSVGDEELVANPLARYCLCDLTPAQQQALQSDLDLASRIQSSLLPPQDVRHAGWQVHHRYLPAGPASGDYCDVVARRDDGRSLYFLFGDVSGKGVSAALVMAHLNALFRSLLDQGLGVAALVDRANRMLLENRIASHYATLVCANAEATGRIELCNAGHCPPLVVRDGEVREVKATGLPVGLVGEGGYGTAEVRLAPGETLFLYTDGIVEARDGQDREYGQERLAGVLRASRRRSPAAMAAACLEDLALFLGGAARADDLTLMVVRRVE